MNESQEAEHEEERQAGKKDTSSDPRGYRHFACLSTAIMQTAEFKQHFSHREALLGGIQASEQQRADCRVVQETLRLDTAVTDRSGVQHSRLRRLFYDRRTRLPEVDKDVGVLQATSSQDLGRR